LNQFKSSMGMNKKEETPYVLLAKSQISIVFSLTQQNTVDDLGDQIASKNDFEFGDENIIHD
jgi:hypothetical protein